jgi:exonuclease I
MQSKMKKIAVIALFCFTSVLAKAQYKPDIVTNGTPLTFTGVIKVDSTLKKSDLYSKGLEWFASVFKNTKAVIQMQDRETGIIVGQGAYSVIHPKSGLIREQIQPQTFKVQLSFKDGRFKYDFTEFDDKDYFGIVTDGEVTKWPSFSKSVMKRYYKETQDQTKAEAESLIANLTEYFKNNNKSTDW